MKVLFIALVICAVALATSVPEKPLEKPAEEKNKTVTADKPARDARYLLLDSGYVYDRSSNYVLDDVVLNRGSYVVEEPLRSRTLSRIAYY